MVITDPCWEPDDPTQLYDPWFLFPTGYLMALGRALARDHPDLIHRERRRYMDPDTVARFFGVESIGVGDRISGGCTSTEAAAEHGGAEGDDDDSGADHEAALEEGWDSLVCSIDQLLHVAGEEEEAASCPDPDPAAMARLFGLEEDVAAVGDSTVGCSATTEAAEHGGTEEGSSKKDQQEERDYVLVGTAEEIERERQQEAALEDGCDDSRALSVSVERRPFLDEADKQKQQQAAAMAAWNSLVHDIEPPLAEARIEVGSSRLDGWSGLIQELWDVAAPKAKARRREEEDDDDLTAAEWDVIVRGNDAFLREEAALEAERNSLVVPAASIEQQFFWDDIDESFLRKEQAALLELEAGPGRAWNSGGLVPFFDNANLVPADEQCIWDIDDHEAGVTDYQVADDYGGAICDDDYFRVPKLEAGDGAVGGQAGSQSAADLLTYYFRE